MAVIINPDKTIGAYVAELPKLAKVFEKFGIDYCCGGKKTILEACQEKGVDQAAVIADLEALLSLTDSSDVSHAIDSLSQLCEHIVSTHHQYLYESLPRLTKLVEKVSTVHGDKDQRLAELNAVFRQLVDDLVPHLAKEEQVLFPFCKQLDAGTSPFELHCGIESPILVMESEHETVGALLLKIRNLTDNFTPPEWACNTYRVLLDSLKEMEEDLHQHIHKENNILFPKALAKAHVSQC